MSASVIHQLESSAQVTLLGRFGDEGTILTSTPDTLVSGCGSPMFPNIKPIYIQKIKPCKKSMKCEYLACLKKNGKLTHDFNYRIVSTMQEFRIMPTDKNQIIIIYNAQKNTITIQ
jgi:hypothetical protein